MSITTPTAPSAHDHTTPHGGARNGTEHPGDEDHGPGKPAPALQVRPVGFVGVFRSEWVKVKSLRSNTALLAGAAAVMLVIGLLLAATTSGLISVGDGGGAAPTSTDPVGATLQGTTFAALVISILGILAITSEYATGAIRTTLTMVPTRLPVLGAKIAVIGVLTFVAMFETSVVTFLLGQGLIGAGGGVTAALTDPGVYLALIGNAAYLTGIALMGLAAGVLLRSTAGAISSIVGVLFLLPLIISLVLPGDWADAVSPYLPTNAASSFTSVNPAPDLLDPAAGGLVFAAWVVVPLAAAAVSFVRRPA